jgi:signal peptidase
MKKKINFKTVFITIINVFILSIITSYLLSSIKVLSGQQAIATVFNYTGAIVESGSMSPYAEVGDYLIIKKIDAEKVKEDDVITFVNNGVLVTHRIKEVVNEDNYIKFKTQGDSNNILDDEQLDQNNIVGKSIAVIPKVGSVIRFISSKIGLTIGIMMIFLICTPGERCLPTGVQKEKKEEKRW